MYDCTSCTGFCIEAIEEHSTWSTRISCDSRGQICELTEADGCYQAMDHRTKELIMWLVCSS